MNSTKQSKHMTTSTLSRGESKSGVKTLTQQFEKNMQISEKVITKETPVSEEQDRPTMFASAKMKRKSFASQKPLARVSLISKSAISFDSGNKTLVENTISEESQIINRRAAFRKISNLAKGVIPENKRIARFSKADQEIPGTFSPRTSLKRQRSISADSLADIRSSHSPTRASDNKDICKNTHTTTLTNDTKDCEAVKDRRTTFSDISRLSVSNPEMNNSTGATTNLKKALDQEISVEKQEEVYSFRLSSSTFVKRNEIVEMCHNKKSTIIDSASCAKARSTDDQHGRTAKPLPWDNRAMEIEEAKKNLGRTISDTAVTTQHSHPRLVKFASDVEQVRGTKRLQRTPTPYWVDKSDSCDKDFDESAESFESGGSIDLPKFL